MGTPPAPRKDPRRRLDQREKVQAEVDEADKADDRARDVEDDVEAGDAGAGCQRLERGEESDVDSLEDEHADEEVDWGREAPCVSSVR